MADLKDIQAQFKNAVMAGDKSFLSQIEGGGKITPERRLYIYQHAYSARLVEVLQEDFPVLHSMLGDEAFDVLCHQYINAHPSSHPSLRYFGQHLETFVTKQAPYKNQPIIGEMARFEWTFHDVFDAVDKDSINLTDVEEIPAAAWTTLRFEFNPSLYRLLYQWNVPAVWTSVKEEANQPTLPEELPETVSVIQWRHNLKSYFRTLDPDEEVVLTLAMSQKAFPEICEGLIDFYGDQAPVRAAELLRNWVNEGLVSGLDYMDITP